MRRREFLGAAIGATILPTKASGSRLSTERPSLANSSAGAASSRSADALSSLKPMAVGLMIQPASGAEVAISRVKDLGLSNCFLSLDGYIGHFTPLLAQELNGLLQKYSVVATSAEVVGPGRLVWDFLDGPSTIGLVPRETRAARIDALKQTSDFAKMLGIPRVQTHCGFIPENPRDPLYDEAVLAIREVAQYCATNGQDFLMETGQETPTTLVARAKGCEPAEPRHRFRHRESDPVRKSESRGRGGHHWPAREKRSRKGWKVPHRPDATR